MAAAFGRLCVETNVPLIDMRDAEGQPPSGGCVLKLRILSVYRLFYKQPPSGGCVLKPAFYEENPYIKVQPPSGGCVLKP